MTHNNVTIRPYRAVDAIELKAKSGIFGANYWCNFEQDAKSAELSGPGYTAMMNGEIIGCGGVRVFWNGCGEAWALFPPEIKHLKRELITLTKEYLDLIVRAYKLRWIQATPKKSFNGSVILLKHLGFKFKCELEGYAPDGEDCVLYALVMR